MRHLFAALAVVTAVLATAAVPAAGAATSAPVAQVQHVRVGADTVTLDCTGTGSPTVILFAGFGDAHTIWAHIQRRLSRRTRVCSYDRLGEGTSSAPRHTMTLAGNARLLHRALAKVRVRGRLVLVGHSIGGDIAVKYARTYRRATAGVVLFDATPPGYLQFVLHLIPASAHGVAAALRGEGTSITSGVNQERLKVAGSRWAPAGSLGRTPLAVVEHGEDIFAPVPRYATRLQRHWAGGQRRLSRLSQRSQLIIATNSGHYIYLDQPQLALDVINSVIGER
jgi:pimeloyl-ACP methyl ester carboxylesterase